MSTRSILMYRFIMLTIVYYVPMANRKIKKQEIKMRVVRSCSICGKKMKVIVYADRSYRGGHHFSGMSSRRGVKYEYWECPKCYWGGK